MKMKKLPIKTNIKNLNKNIKEKKNSNNKKLENLINKLQFLVKRFLCYKKKMKHKQMFK